MSKDNVDSRMGMGLAFMGERTGENAQPDLMAEALA